MTQVASTARTRREALDLEPVFQHQALALVAVAARREDPLQQGMSEPQQASPQTSFDVMGGCLAAERVLD